VIMMKCTDIQKYLDDYLDDAMSLGEQKAVEAHVKYCVSCQQALEAHKTIRQALRSLPVDEASPDFEANVFAAVRSHYGTHSRHSGNRFIAGFATAMVASLALWFASIWRCGLPAQYIYHSLMKQHPRWSTWL